MYERPWRGPYLGFWQWAWIKICCFIDWWWPFIGIKPPQYNSFDPASHPPFPAGSEKMRADIEFVYRYFDPQRRNLSRSTIAALTFCNDQILGDRQHSTYVRTLRSCGAWKPWAAPKDLESALQNYWIGYGIAPIAYRKYD